MNINRVQKLYWGIRDTGKRRSVSMWTMHRVAFRKGDSRIFVKIVHIKVLCSDMQPIIEAYNVFKPVGKLTNLGLL